MAIGDPAHVVSERIHGGVRRTSLPSFRGVTYAFGRVTVSRSVSDSVPALIYGIPPRVSDGTRFGRAT